MSDKNHKEEQTVWHCKKCLTKHQPHCRLVMAGSSTNQPVCCPFKPELAAEWKEYLIGKF